MSTDLIQQLKKRRSVRKYEKKPVEKDLIEEIIQAGKYAPSATNRQPWRFIVITKKEMIDRVSDVIKNEIKNMLKKRFILKYKYPSLKNDNAVQLLAATALSKEDMLFFNAPVLVFILSENKRFYKESCACCAQNMMLAAHSLGLGSCWIGFANFLELNKEWMKKIGVPDGFHISSCLVFGYPEGKLPKASLRKPLADVIKWI